MTHRYFRGKPINLLIVLLIALLSACESSSDTSSSSESKQPGAVSQEAEMNKLAEAFVKLALALGEHDRDYVDAYHGPKEWREQAKSSALSLEEIQSKAKQHASKLQQIQVQSDTGKKRWQFLSKQFSSLQSRAAIVAGKKFTFDAESEALYDAVAPTLPFAHYDQILAKLEQALPGTGTLGERVEKFREDFTIPSEKLDTVFQAAIAECRKRTQQFIELPANESFTVEYVGDKSWSGYNWFQGDARSLIQVNTDFPIIVDRAVDLACHEGYPGHHVYNSLLEKNLLKDRGWIEFSVFPLFSPTGLIAEGSANYGIDMAFPDEQRFEFEEKIIFPLAGLDSSRVREFYQVEQLIDQLNYASNETARRYIDGAIDAKQAAAELEKYALMTEKRAVQRVTFIDQYRSYVINYNLGRDRVADWVEKGEPDQAERWQRFERLLSEPTLPSQLLLDGA